MQATRSPRGRKPIAASQGQRAALGLKVTPQIKNALDDAARANGRSQSREAETRLENSFRDANILLAALDLAYGETNTALLLLIAKLMDNASGFAGARGHNRNDWLDDGAAFDKFSRTVNQLFESLRPDDPARWDDGANPHADYGFDAPITSLSANDSDTDAIGERLARPYRDRIVANYPILKNAAPSALKSAAQGTQPKRTQSSREQSKKTRPKGEQS